MSRPLATLLRTASRSSTPSRLRLRVASLSHSSPLTPTSRPLTLASTRARAGPLYAAPPSTNVVANSTAVRTYAASAGLSHQEIQNRIVDVLKSFEKVDPAKVTASSSFTADLGLDSLDAVEVVMAIEEEFSIEIPDAEADNITTVQQAIDYVAKTPEAN